jgi:DNA-binding XRE family transcriptional regulator
LQKDVGRLVGVDTTTITNWEKNRTKPSLRLMPAVIRYLGYSPIDAGGSFGGSIKAMRRHMGISQRHLAMLLGVDPATLARWERNRSQPSEKLRPRLERLF